MCCFTFSAYEVPLPRLTHRSGDDDQCCQGHDDDNANDNHGTSIINEFVKTPDSLSSAPQVTAEELDDWFGMEKIPVKLTGTPDDRSKPVQVIKEKKKKSHSKHVDSDDEEITPNPLVVTVPSESSDENPSPSPSPNVGRIKTAPIRSSPMPDFSTEGKIYYSMLNFIFTFKSLCFPF